MERFKQFEEILQKPVIKEIIAKGGNVYFVGGCVRDAIMSEITGVPVISKDIDIVVQKLQMNELKEILQKFGLCFLVGESFAVVKYKESDGFELDIALPRRDSRAANYDEFENAHAAIDVQSDPFMTIEGDLYRRDFTINSIAVSQGLEIVDPYNGVQDMKMGLIKATNPEAFADDPLRLMRAIRFSLRFGFKPDKETFELMQKNGNSLSRITKQRKKDELILIMKDHAKNNFPDFLHKVTTLFSFLNLYKEILGFVPEIVLFSLNNKITSLSEFLLCFRHANKDFNYSHHYHDHFGLKRDNREMNGLNFLIKGIIENENEEIAVRKTFFNAMKLWPEGVNESNLFKLFLTDFEDNKLPKSRKELSVNGKTLQKLGFKGKQIADVTEVIMNTLFELKLKNSREEVIKFAKTLLQ